LSVLGRLHHYNELLLRPVVLRQIRANPRSINSLPTCWHKDCCRCLAQ